MTERRGAPREGADKTRVPVVEERAAIDRQRTETGRVRVRLRDRVEPREVVARLARTRVEVESVPRDELLEERPEPRREGDVFVFPVAEEVLVVQSRWRLVEEVRVRPREEQRDEKVSVQLARRDVVVERDDGDTTRDVRR